MALLLSPDASAQYKWGDCIKVTRLSDKPGDSVLVISIEDTCRHRADTVFVDGHKQTGDYVLEAADTSIVITCKEGVDYWQSTFRLVPADTIRFLGLTFYVGTDTIWTTAKVVVPDTIRIAAIPAAVATGGGDSTFIDHTDTPLTYVGAGGKFVAVTGGEDGLEFVDAPAGGGSSTFTGLTDTPSSYTGKAGQVPYVNGTETGMAFQPLIINGTLTSATLVWDTVGVYVDSAAYVYRMEWMPAVLPYRAPSGASAYSDDVSADQRIGMVKYRLFLNNFEAGRLIDGKMAFAVRIVGDSVNQVMIAGVHFEAFSVAKDNIDEIPYSQYSWGQMKRRPDYAADYDYVGDGNTYMWSILTGWTGTLWDTGSDPITGMAGRHQIGIWIGNYAYDVRSVGYIDLTIMYMQAHGYQSTWAVKIADVRYMGIPTNSEMPY
ncbi:MAG: hypothetical protein IH600_15120 [Bacteroidetes bacterium]|nr:hypothetical protein [Bacteroidota bacterium]